MCLLLRVLRLRAVRDNQFQAYVFHLRGLRMVALSLFTGFEYFEQLKLKYMFFHQTLCF